MMNLVTELQEWNDWAICGRLLLSFFCGMLLGLSPEYKRRPAGMRTYILVCIGAATATMTGFYAFYSLEMSIDPLRIAAQVISGIGFLGVGTIIIIGRKQVLGLTTAAGLWTSAAVGIAIGSGFYLAGLLCTLLALVTMTLLEGLERMRSRKQKRIDIYLEITDVNKVNRVIGILHNPKYCISDIQIKPARSEKEDNLGVEATLKVNEKQDKHELLDEISEIENIAFAIESE